MNEIPKITRPEGIEADPDPALEAATLVVAQRGMGWADARAFVLDFNALLCHYVSLLPKE